MSLFSIKNKLLIFVLIASLIMTPFFAMKPACRQAWADLVDEIEGQIQEKNSQVKELENRAEEYKDIIKDLQIKQQTLENEIELLDAQIAQLDLEIQSTQARIDQTNLEINNLLIRIQIKEEEMENQKDILKKLLRRIDSYDKETILEILLKSEELSDFLNQTEYMNAIGEKVKEALDALKAAKKDLEEKEKETERKKIELEELNKKLIEQKETVDAQKKSKGTLLKETMGKEYKYQDLLFNVRNQKKMILGDINELKKNKEAEIARIAALAERPSENLASTSWYFSQNDPRWKDATIGFSNSTIDNYGCAISSVAMIFRYYGIDIDPGRLAKQPIFYRDLIAWPQQWRYLDLVRDSRHKSGGLDEADWNSIDREIANGHPVIVFIKALGRGAGHYVVIHSKDSKDYVVHDPVMWNSQSGANIYLSTTRKYLESLYGTNTIIDQYIIYH